MIGALRCWAVVKIVRYVSIRYARSFPIIRVSIVLCTIIRELPTVDTWYFVVYETFKSVMLHIGSIISGLIDHVSLDFHEKDKMLKLIRKG